jgi:hypothetical protein
MQVIDATGASKLPADLKLLVFAMSYLADSKTGRGLTGQAKLGRFISCSDRAVRQKLEKLAASPDSPVQVVRRPRSRTDGRGRTSDEYQLVLTNRKQTSGETRSPSGSSLPVEPDDQPEVQSGPTGSPRYDQPEAHFQGSSQGSSERILGDSLSRSARTARGSAKTPKQPSRPKAPKPEREPEEKQAHQALTAHYHAEFERLRGTKPIGWGAKEGKAVWELLDKCKGDLARARTLVTNGLGGWGKATIMWIASNPSACLGPAPTSSSSVRAGDLLPRQLQRVAELEAAEARGRALP